MKQIIIGFILGLFIIPFILRLLGLPSLGDVFHFVLGEPTFAKSVILSVITILLLFLLYKSYKKNKET
nr:hypothetical protein [Paenibacillus bovis]